MLKHWENYIPEDVLPYFDEVVIVANKTDKGGEICIEVGNYDKKPYSSVTYEWTEGHGPSVIRHAFDFTEGSLEAKRGKPKKKKKKKKKSK